MDKPLNAIEWARAAGLEAQRLYPGEAGETWRAIKGYEALVELNKAGYSDAIAKELLDPNTKIKSKPAKPTLFDISERSIRRVKKIAKEGKLEILVFCARASLSLEVAEHMIINPSTEMIEAAWLAATPAHQAEFLRRRVKR